MIPDFKLKLGRLTVYSTERFYEGWVEHFRYIRQRGVLWRHYIWRLERGDVCTQVKVLGFIFTWWSKDRVWVDRRPTQWERLLGGVSDE